MNTSINFNEKKGFICDMDGVIYHGNRVLPGVAEFIQWLHQQRPQVLSVYCSRKSRSFPKNFTYQEAVAADFLHAMAASI